MRLDRLLAQEKISRKAMKQALLKKEILVDDCPARSLAQNVDTGLQKLVFQRRQIQGYEHNYLMLHKPNGVVTASKDKKLPTVRWKEVHDGWKFLILASCNDSVWLMKHEVGVLVALDLSSLKD